VDILSVAIIAFVVIETLNIGMLYSRPGSRLGNGIGVFNAYRKADADPETGWRAPSSSLWPSWS
jgi:hypothetical protein